MRDKYGSRMLHMRNFDACEHPITGDPWWLPWGGVSLGVGASVLWLSCAMIRPIVSVTQNIEIDMGKAAGGLLVLLPKKE